MGMAEQRNDNKLLHLLCFFVPCITQSSHLCILLNQITIIFLLLFSLSFFTIDNQLKKRENNFLEKSLHFLVAMMILRWNYSLCFSSDALVNNANFLCIVQIFAVVFFHRFSINTLRVTITRRYFSPQSVIVGKRISHVFHHAYERDWNISLWSPND